jgi:hypothetical protein
MTDNKKLATFWTYIDEDPRVERIEVTGNVTRWKIFTSVRSIEDQEQLRQDMVEDSGLQPDQFEIIFE